ncbi:ABC transporter ATP-binding protein [Microbacteriaceae bacterium VKM Ac-2854]|nr:ABC transporter ATP-binding protein [Microbacteriaceae bacterium VKM Ac-2854]
MNTNPQWPVADGRATRRVAWSLLRTHPWALTLSALTVLASSIAGLATPALLGGLVQGLSDGSAPLALFVALLAVAVLAQSVLGVFARTVVGSLGERLVGELRVRVFDTAMRIPLDRVERAGTGGLVSRVSGDVRLVGIAAGNLLPPVIAACFTIALTLGGLLVLDGWFLLAALVVLPFHVLSVRSFLPRSGRVYAEAREAEAQRAEQTIASINGIDTVRAYRVEQAHRGAIEQRSLHAQGLNIRAMILVNRFWAGLNLAEFAGLAAILLIGFLLVRADAITVGGATTAALYFHRVFDPIGSVLQSVDQLQKAATALARLAGVLEPDEPAAPRGASSAPSRLRIRSLHFGYAEGPDVLHGIDLDIAAGERVAFVGTTGAGKSTLAALIAGIHQPRSGTVTTDRGARVGLVSQDVHVFAGTLREDLLLADPHAADEKLQAALDLVGSALSLDSELGAGALTSAEAQRIALARLALADPAIAILDEATAEAGSAGARELEAAADAVLAGRTAIVVAHRLTQAAASDRVIVLAEGRIVEQGSHAALVAAGGPYARLWSAWSSRGATPVG